MQIVKLSELYDGLYDGPHATPKPAESGPVFLGIKNITEDGRLDLTNVRHISEDEFPKWTKRVTPQAGDIVFSYEATLHRYAIIPEGFHGCLGRRMALIRPNKDRVNTEYLFNYFFTDQWRTEVSKYILSGATVDRIPLTKAPDFEVTVHDRGEQDEVAEVVSNYNNLIENNNRRIAILEDMAQSLYREWFVKFRFPGHENVKFKDSPLGQIPEGWEVKALGEFSDLTMGLSPKGNTYNDLGIGTPLVNGPVEFGEKLTKRVKWTTSPTRFCDEGDLIVCVRGSTTGKNVKSDGKYCLGRGVCAISGKFLSFTCQMFKTELPRLLAQTSGSTFPSWTGPQLKSYPVIVPSTSLLQEFESIVSPMDSLIITLSRQSDRAMLARDMLLPKLISGQINLKD